MGEPSDVSKSSQFQDDAPPPKQPHLKSASKENATGESYQKSETNVQPSPRQKHPRRKHGVSYPPPGYPPQPQAGQYQQPQAGRYQQPQTGQYQYYQQPVVRARPPPEDRHQGLKVSFNNMIMVYIYIYTYFR